jgi:alpha-tubulin suppressor-like RCC1 family protein
VKIFTYLVGDLIGKFLFLKIFLNLKKRYGQIGNDEYNEINVLLPVEVKLSLQKNQKISLISAGYYHSVILVTNTNDSNENEIFAWGGNNFGQLGDNTTIDRNLPIKSINIDIIKNKIILKLFAMTSYSILLTLGKF